MCVFLTCYDQLDPSACTEQVINLMKRALMPDWRRHCCLCAGAGIHATNCLLIPKAMIWTCLSFLLLLFLKFFVYRHVSGTEPWRIACSPASFVYCQNGGDRLGGYGRSCTFTGLFFFLLKQYRQLESSKRSRLWDVRQIFSFWSGRTCMNAYFQSLGECAQRIAVIQKHLDNLIPSLSAGLSWCKWW